MTVHHLTRPGATLYCEVRGEGPSLLLITGGNGDSEAYGALVAELADRYRVITYDPRGYSRSPLAGPPVEQDVPTNADDAAAVLTALAETPALVFGSSSGAQIALDLTARYPELVRIVVAHEPPAVTLLPDHATHHAAFHRVRDEYAERGVEPAWALFGEVTGLREGDDEPLPDPATLPPHLAGMVTRTLANRPFFLAYGMLPAVAFRPDLDVLATVRTEIVPAGGVESGDQLPARPVRVLADRLGTEVVGFPGGHAGYAERPTEFALRLTDILG
ncbi:alpha/beta fold hydrolase [Actinocatenispora rupis]|uniref:Putative hydrolase YraK n=1 Tax=Actinocatenispora rupis TaxID=519421 RepID=A0A8J3JK58_9ACTN|nr:alpha/beta hydrolase [Actinocatenispora rupis]GID16398.1 putative hydrolase YraK [Actinocatenispora rupis]